MKINEFAHLIKGQHIKCDNSYELFVDNMKAAKVISTEFGIFSLDLNIAMESLGVVKLNEESVLCKFVKNKKLFYNGKPMTDTLTMIVDNELTERFIESGVVVGKPEKTEDVNNNFVVIDLNKISFEQDQSKVFDVKDIAAAFFDYTVCKIQRKLINYYNPKPAKDKFEKLKSIYSEEVVTRLKSIGVSDDGYRPSFSSDNVYEKPMTISMAGFTNLPKVEDVLNRIQKKSAHTTAGKLMADNIAIYEQAVDKGSLVEYWESMESVCENILRGTVYSYILNKNLKVSSMTTKTEIIDVNGYFVTITMKL